LFPSLVILTKLSSPRKKIKPVERGRKGRRAGGEKSPAPGLAATLTVRRTPRPPAGSTLGAQTP